MTFKDIYTYIYTVTLTAKLDWDIAGMFYTPRVEPSVCHNRPAHARLQFQTYTSGCTVHRQLMPIPAAVPSSRGGALHYPRPLPRHPIMNLETAGGTPTSPPLPELRNMRALPYLGLCGRVLTLVGLIDLGQPLLDR